MIWGSRHPLTPTKAAPDGRYTQSSVSWLGGLSDFVLTALALPLWSGRRGGAN